MRSRISSDVIGRYLTYFHVALRYDTRTPLHAVEILHSSLHHSRCSQLVTVKYMSLGFDALSNSSAKDTLLKYQEFLPQHEDTAGKKRFATAKNKSTQTRSS